MKKKGKVYVIIQPQSQYVLNTEIKCLANVEKTLLANSFTVMFVFLKSKNFISDSEMNEIPDE